MNRLSAEEFSTRYAAWIAKNKIEITSLSGMDGQRGRLTLIRCGVATAQRWQTIRRC